jgi:RNA polymerase sigma factor (sigma-70 family)
VGKKAGPMQTLIPKRDTFIPTRQTLLNRLKDCADQESWKEFFELYWKLIYRTALKAGLSEADAEDVVQETIIALCKRLPDFTYDPKVGSFKGYLLTLTSWRIKDHIRERFTTSDRQIAWLADPNGFVPETFWDEEWQNNLLEVARERVKQKVNPKHYQIFDLHVDQSWPAHKVARTMGVSTARVYLIRHRITNLLRKEIKKLQAEEQKHHEHRRQ